MSRNTKTKILESALEIFARDGYSGTNIKDISESVGIVKSAFYRHYESKEEIWNAVIAMMTSYYEENFGSADSISEIPGNAEELYDMTMKMVNFTVHDRKVVLMRRIILTEQFRDDNVRKLATKYFVDDTQDIFENVFVEMMKKGVLIERDPKILAFAYTSPITTLIHLCDREPERIDETMMKVQDFIKEFIYAHEIRGWKLQ